MKISWGHKILFAYLAFVGGILFMVFKASQEKYDLVTPNYYEAELKYQEVIDQRENTEKLSAQPKISHSVNTLSIQLPLEFLNAQVKGDVHLYRASDAGMDIRKSFETQQAFIRLPLGKDLSGNYDLKLSWQANGKFYYQEQKIVF